MNIVKRTYITLLAILGVGVEKLINGGRKVVFEHLRE